MAYDIRKIKDTTDLIGYFSENLGWNIDMDYVDDIEDIAYDFTAADIGLKEDAFARISALRQMQPLVDGQKWGIFCVEFDSQRFEVGALRKILSKLIPRRRNSADHAVWDQQDLLFICNWGKDNNRTIGLAHFEDQGKDLPQIRMISCAPAVEDFTQIKIFEDRLSLLRWPKDTSNIEEWRRTWASAFTTGYREVIHTSALLTTRLAAEAQNIRNHILEILEVETENGYVHKLFDKFRETLIHDMTETQFADMYAQTVVYGLFSARCMDATQDNFSAAEAVNCIPNTNPFLKNLMRECLGANSSRLSFDEMEIGNVVELLRNTHTDAIIQDFNRQTGGGREDPVIHFYEEFLTAYDKAQKVQRGVYYTPQPVVNFIVRAVDDILKTEFGLPEGLASTATKQVKTQRLSERKINGMYRMIDTMATVPAVQVLDPATGTGTFLRQVILQIYENFKQQHRGESREAIRAAWNEYVPKHLLPRINGFELMMAPYAVAHMKLAMVLKDTGYDFGGEGRLNVCLTNTLEAPGNSEDQISMFDDPLATESVEANKVKKNTGVSIFLGNPPYSGESANKGEYIAALMDAYKMEPGGLIKLQEKNPKWLNDDYVKFIRYAEDAIVKAGTGILAFVNPHGFIANPTFRGMRWHLMQSFDEIHIIDLHGNSNRKETCPDGSKDENVFDIQQGVGIFIFVRKNNNIAKRCKVYHTDFFGTRLTKYERLYRNDVAGLLYESLVPKEPAYLFAPVNESLESGYIKGFSVNDLFNLSSVGIVTARDSLTMDFSIDAIREKAETFAHMPTETAREHFCLGKDVRDWRVEWAQKDIIDNAMDNGHVSDKRIVSIMYRVFDRRYIVNTGTSRGFVCYPRMDVMKHMLNGANIALATARSNKSDSCSHFYVTNTIMEAKCAERTTQSCLFPLYVYCEIAGQVHKSVNFKPETIKTITQHLGLRYTGEISSVSTQEYSAEDLFYYIYAYLYSNKYRTRYAQFLKSDYPRIPYPASNDIFWALSKLGQRLCAIHIIDDNTSVEPHFCTVGGNNVDKPKWKDDKVYINKESYFYDVSEVTWNFMIGGYSPLQRWFKERKGMALEQEDILHYQRMINAIDATQRIMDDIDAVIEL